MLINFDQKEAEILKQGVDKIAPSLDARHLSVEALAVLEVQEKLKWILDTFEQQEQKRLDKGRSILKKARENKYLRKEKANEK